MSTLKKMCQPPMTHTIASREHYLNLQAVCPLFELQYSAADSFFNPHLIQVKPPNVPTLCTAMKVTTQYACKPAVVHFEPLNSLASMMQIVKWTLCICKTYVLDETKWRAKNSKQSAFTQSVH